MLLLTSRKSGGILLGITEIAGGYHFFWRGTINFRRGPNRLIATLQNVTGNTTSVEILLAGGGRDFEIEYLLLPFGGFWSSIYGAVLIE